MKTLNDYMALPYRLEIVEDQEEGGYVVSYPDLPGCITCGDTIEEGIEINEPDSIEDYSGQFKLRIPKTLHRTLALHARKEGISMNQYCVYLLSRNDALLSK